MVNRYHNIYHRTIKMKPVDVKSSTNIEFNVENDDKHSKLEVVDHVRISKYKKFFEKGYNVNWSDDSFVIKKVKNTVLWTHIIVDLNGEENIGTFSEKIISKSKSNRMKLGRKIMIIHLITRQIKKGDSIKTSQYF